MTDDKLQSVGMSPHPLFAICYLLFANELQTSSRALCRLRPALLARCHISLLTNHFSLPECLIVDPVVSGYFETPLSGLPITNH